MTALILSGVGGSTNWLPLIYPLAAVVIIVRSFELIVQYAKKWKAHKRDRLAAHDTGNYLDDTSNTL